MRADFSFIYQWWLVLFFIGISCLPITFLLFQKFFDRGYIFAKIIGIIVLSYLTLIFGESHVLSFSTQHVLFILLAIGIGNMFVLVQNKYVLQGLRSVWKFFILEEFLFFIGLWFWSYIRATSPDIHGLEKYMDYGFVNSILRSTYFPPKDMWYPPFFINYYYFGHFVTAVLTRLSRIPSYISFNLMIATLFAFTLTASSALGAQVVKEFLKERFSIWTKKATVITILSAIIIGYLTTFGGNLHTIYAFYKQYEAEKPQPFWQLPFLPHSVATNGYWYPNATRFIYHTIHEFPMYSFVVADLHGHVLDIPFVLLILAVLFSFLLCFKNFKTQHLILNTIFIGFLLAVMYMTNAWDGIIYFLLTMLVVGFVTGQTEKTIYPEKSFSQILFSWNYLFNNAYTVALTFTSFVFFSLPFSLFFKPFASQIGVLCAPGFLTKIGHLGPLLFEANHCEHSPLYQLLILHGFFLFWVFGFIVFLRHQKKKTDIYPSDIFVLLLSALSIFLIIVPEFIYLKDIYPAHYRANTMFKLVYQSFMMLSLCSGYTIIRIITSFKSLRLPWRIGLSVYWIIGMMLSYFIVIYPNFAINSYYGNLKNYYGLNGTTYLYRQYPDDYAAIQWLNYYIPDQPVILEAHGDSYTDYARVSANTGLLTPLGWTVHEWLWRGSYDPLPSRIDDIQKLYETKNTDEAKMLARKYHVSLVFIGSLEKQKYPHLEENKFLQFGKIIFQQKNTKIYRIYP